jgi:hypothetical protein
MTDLAENRGFGSWASWYLRASYLLMWGLFMIVLSGEDLLEQRFGSVPSSFRIPLSVAMFIVLAWQVWALWPRDPESEAEKSPGVILLAAICIGVLTLAT